MKNELAGNKKDISNFLDSVEDSSKRYYIPGSLKPVRASEARSMVEHLIYVIPLYEQMLVLLNGLVTKCTSARDEFISAYEGKTAGYSIDLLNDVLNDLQYYIKHLEAKLSESKSDLSNLQALLDSIKGV